MSEWVIDRVSEANGFVTQLRHQDMYHIQIFKTLCRFDICKFNVLYENILLLRVSRFCMGIYNNNM